MSEGLGTAWGLLCGSWGVCCWVGGEMTVWRWEVKVDMSTWRRRVAEGAEGVMLCSTGWVEGLVCGILGG